MLHCCRRREREKQVNQPERTWDKDSRPWQCFHTYLIANLWLHRPISMDGKVWTEWSSVRDPSVWRRYDSSHPTMHERNPHIASFLEENLGWQSSTRPRQYTRSMIWRMSTYTGEGFTGCGHLQNRSRGRMSTGDDMGILDTEISS